MRYFLFIAIIYSCEALFSQYTFEKGYGTLDADYGHSVVQISDNGYFITGYTTNFYFGNPEVYAIKTNEGGDVIWSYTGDHPTFWNKAYNGIQCYDGGFAVCSYNYDSSSFYHSVITKLNQNGLPEWEKNYGNNVNSCPKAIIQKPDSGFIFCGYYYEQYSTYSSFIFRIDKTGNVLWSKEYSEPSINSTFNDIVDAQNGSYVLCGTNRYEDDLVKAWVLKVDSVGEEEWQLKTAATNFNLSLYSVKKTPDNAYILCGKKWEPGILPDRDTDIYLVKVNSDGAVLWEKTFGEEDIQEYANEVDISDDGAYIITGSDGSAALLMKINELGDVLWEQTFDVSSGATSVYTTSDGGYAICGSSINFGFGLSDVYLLKTDVAGIVTSVYYPNIVTNKSNIFPNPCDNQFYIESEDIIQRLYIYSNSGKLIDRRSPKKEFESVSTQAYQSGVYYVKVVTLSGVEIKRVVVK